MSEELHEAWAVIRDEDSWWYDVQMQERDAAQSLRDIEREGGEKYHLLRLIPEKSLPVSSIRSDLLPVLEELAACLPRIDERHSTHDYDTVAQYERAEARRKATNAFLALLNRLRET